MIDAVKLTEYNIWANKRLGGQIKQLSNELFLKEVGGSFPSIQLTLVHLMETEWIWMHRWQGVPLVSIPGDWPINNAHSLVNTWTAIQDQIEGIVKQRATEEIKEVEFITKKGVAYSMPFIDTIMHATNHGTYHRGQIVNMIKMLGETPVSTDYFIFCTVNKV